jgi:hypothetical protein
MSAGIASSEFNEFCLLDFVGFFHVKNVKYEKISLNISLVRYLLNTNNQFLILANNHE